MRSRLDWPTRRRGSAAHGGGALVADESATSHPPVHKPGYDSARLPLATATTPANGPVGAAPTLLRMTTLLGAVGALGALYVCALAYASLRALAAAPPLVLPSGELSQWLRRFAQLCAWTFTLIASALVGTMTHLQNPRTPRS